MFPATELFMSEIFDMREDPGAKPVGLMRCFSQADGAVPMICIAFGDELPVLIAPMVRSEARRLALALLEACDQSTPEGEKN